MRLELLLHLQEDSDVVRVNRRQVGAAVVHRERGEPSEDGGSDARVRAAVGRGDLRVVKRDVGGEGVEELLLGIHGNILQREFPCEEVIANMKNKNGGRELGSLY